MEKSDNPNNKKKIAIVIDVEGWAFDNSAKQIKNHLSNYYDIDIIPMDIFNGNIVKLFILSKKYDLTHFMWRGHISWINSEFSKYYISTIGEQYEKFENEYLKGSNITTAVCDHLFLDEAGKDLTNFVCNNVKSYIVISKKLYDIYSRNDNIKNPEMIISNGVDLELFYKKNKNKYNDLNDREIIIGWTGNSKFLDETDDDLKGVKKIIKPAVEELISEGYKIKLNIADRNERFIPHDKMPDYYNDIDIYLCASRTEGAPNTILEAMACGVPIISTDVGIVPEVLGTEQKKFIINRTKEDLKNSIKELLNNREKMKILSEENLERVKKYSWEEQANKYKKFFDMNLE